MDHSLPNQELERSDSDDSSVYVDEDTDYNYVIRLTPQGKYEVQDVERWLRSQTRFSSWVLATETLPRKHYHLVVSVSNFDEDAFDIKPLVREFLFTYWPIRERGWGNAQYNCQLTQDLTQAITYAVKEKTFIYEGYAPEFIEECSKNSFTKNSTKTFTIEFNELKTQFLTEDMEPKTFMVKFIQLKAKYSQMVNVSHAYQYMLSLQVQKDPQYALEIAENYLYKQ
uniref:Replication-associated protein n=1 Tax=Cressdnaviricota sp. TaxID=2748378 RepID=A0A6M9Z8H9_9VIRU|nr:MAG: replication-associated protein [Cressdnaviricota sp.]